MKGSTVWALCTGGPSAAVLLCGQLLSACTASWEVPVSCQYYWTCQLWLQQTHTHTITHLAYLDMYSIHACIADTSSLPTHQVWQLGQ